PALRSVAFRSPSKLANACSYTVPSGPTNLKLNGFAWYLPSLQTTVTCTTRYTPLSGVRPSESVVCCCASERVTSTDVLSLKNSLVSVTVWPSAAVAGPAASPPPCESPPTV